METPHDTHVKAGLLHGVDKLREVLFQVLGRHARDKGHPSGLVGGVNHLKDLNELLWGTPADTYAQNRVTQNRVSQKHDGDVGRYYCRNKTVANSKKGDRT